MMLRGRVPSLLLIVTLLPLPLLPLLPLLLLRLMPARRVVGEDGGEQLGSGFLVVMASLVIGAFFQLVDDRSR